ncbi:ScbA/BarX family gamma-butyrolactone biosynthesis protein [Streptomyces sp. NBC_00557]|uniref:ScbA/BarX family gamma-butyrolactone biosynthesis protein n=1 Tax=Streptomyces sp. NBC_00557 TaxID=2975776 RepID=UPI002E8228ED|nr:ScbA/BarX family gamma-butyrolactone biosynthesis protein [Streptomyces sp. NBC_00557]WUC33035.1 A-factor biosynthesis protein [Streptomyces sp. NBC_00557]
MQYTRTLPRELVHRAAVAEVFLTDAERHGEDDVLLAAQLPRRHAFYHDTLADRARHDPMLLLEACRQGIFVVAHRYLDVPLGHKFLLRAVEFEVPDPAALVCGDHPTEAVIATRIEHRFRNRAGVTGLRLRFGMTVGDREALLARIDYSWMPPRAWTRLRAGQRGALGLPETPVALPGRRVEPARVGRRDPGNAVISAPRTGPDGTRTARLVPDTGHPALYDHWVDHVPGMLELEALRQLALTAAVDAGALSAPTALPVGLAARFRCFAEMDLPLECRTGPVLPGADIECSLHQPGAVAVEARLRLAEPGPARPTAGALAAPAAHGAV